MKVIKIGAVWCSGCLVMKPRWSKIEAQFDWLDTTYYDYDQDRQIIEMCNVDGENLPVSIFLDKSGKEINRFYGEIEEAELIKRINEYRDR